MLPPTSSRAKKSYSIVLVLFSSQICFTEKALHDIKNTEQNHFVTKRASLFLVQCFLRPHPELKKCCFPVLVELKQTTFNFTVALGLPINMVFVLHLIYRKQNKIIPIQWQALSQKFRMANNRLLLFDLWHTSVCSCSAEEAEACADARWASYPITHLSLPGLVFVQSFPKLPKSAAQSSLFVQTSTLRLLDIVSR